MQFKDLTKDQAISIAILSYGFEDWIDKSVPFDVKYYADEAPSLDNCDGEHEHFLVSFSAIVFGNEYYNIRVLIDPQLNCYVSYIKVTEGKVDALDSLPTRNQYYVQNFFRNIGLEPKKQIK